MLFMKDTVLLSSITRNLSQKFQYNKSHNTAELTNNSDPVNVHSDIVQSKIPASNHHLIIHVTQNLLGGGTKKISTAT